MIRQKLLQSFNQQRGYMVDEECVNRNITSIYKNIILNLIKISLYDTNQPDWNEKTQPFAPGSRFNPCHESRCNITSCCQFFFFFCILLEHRH